MKAIELVVRNALPKELRDRPINLDAKGVEDLLVEVARNHPDDFPRVVQKVNDAGRLAAYTLGETLKLSDLKPVVNTAPIYKAMDAEIKAARKAAKNDSEFERKREEIWLKYSDELEPLTMNESKRLGTGLAYSVVSGARGKAAQLKAMVTTPGVYQDSIGRTVPIFVRHSFSQGLRPYEHLAGSYGARHSVVSTKRCLWEKTLVRMADGTDREIREIKVGEEVLGADKFGRVFPVKVLNNFDQGNKPIRMYSFRRRGADPVIDTRVRVMCTADHKFLREASRRGEENTVVPIRTIAKRDYVLSAGGHSMALVAEQLGPACPCRDLEVDHPDHLFVLTNGIIVSNSTAKGGDLGKQWAQIASHLIVSEENCGVTDGIDIAVGKDLRNRVLARPVAGLEAGTVLDRDAIAHLQRKKVDNVLTRSPLVCRAKFGVCAECAGADARGHLPRIGDMVGITSAQAAAEPVTQAALSTKHTAGQAKGKKRYTGFEYLNQLVQAPEVFKDRAAVSEVEGNVTKIEPAPQGGTNVFINGDPVYVLPGQNVEVKEGQSVEPGDALSDGLVDPRDIVRLRGLGEGRRYLSERLKQMLDDGGAKTDLRHTEMLARAALDHVVIDEPDDDQGVDGLPDDVVFYSKLAQKYVPKKDARRVQLKNQAQTAIGKYLAAPAMHFTIGTKLTPRMLDKVRSAGLDEVTVQDTPPPFTPDMVRLRTATHATDDWLVRMNSSYLTRGLEDSVTAGLDTNVEDNSHWMPRLAYGVGFGEKVRETGKF